MTVYVVNGYIEETAVAVFSTKEAAIAYCEQRTGELIVKGYSGADAGMSYNWEDFEVDGEPKGVYKA